MSAAAEIRAVPGLDEYLDALESRLERAVEARPGIVTAVGKESIAAGGKRLRPVLVFLAAGEATDRTLAAGVAVELLHLATLVHDDVIDRAHLRRGRASVWSSHGFDVAQSGGDYLFARAFAELAQTGDIAGVQILSETALALVRGEALQWKQRHDPSTPVAAYVERCTLKTATLFEAACRLGAADASLRSFGVNLGIAFQIVDDVLDCEGETIETGKIAGVDLREGTPTLPLLLAAREDPVVRAALAGGPREGALVRVAATGALARSRDVAEQYADRARAAVDGTRNAKELEALVTAVLERRA